MIAAIELGKIYAQVCVKTESMREVESVTKIAGEEHYRIPIEADVTNKEELQELFRSLWKMLSIYRSKESLEYLVFCLEENINQECMRKMLLEIVQSFNIPKEKVRFVDKAECFCAYVSHQSSELLTHNALLIENHAGIKEKLLLHKHSLTNPQVLEVHDVSEKSLKDIFKHHGISSVFLVGDDFEQEWLQNNLKLLKTGRRVFVGKNLYVKGACYHGIDLKENKQPYFYLGEEKLCCSIALKAVKDAQETFVTIVNGGNNWYESGNSIEVILLEEPALEFAIIPIHGKEKKTIVVHLNDLPERPKKATRLQIEIEFLSVTCAKLKIKDLGFGELFARSDMVYEGELQWD